MFSPFFKHLVTEATKTTTKTKHTWTEEIPSADDDVQLPSHRVEQPRKQPVERRSLGTVAPQQHTARKAADVLNDPRAEVHLRDLLRSELNAPGAEDATPTDISTDVVTPESLPSVISTSLAKTDTIVPEWHMVKHLPGYMQQAIRKLGKSVFAQYTRTPIENIQVLANVQGQGPNDKREINAIGKWAVENGTKVTIGDIDFSIMPGYKADVVVYNAEGTQLMLVKDAFGQYIYAWPETDSSVGDWTAERRLK